MRPYGTNEELKRRRFHAVELMERGEAPTVISRILGVSRASLWRWREAARAGTLAGKPNLGPRPRLDDEQIAELEKMLEEGATAHGWKNELWTCKRVREVILRRFSISYDPAHIARILRKRLGWTPQLPEHWHTNRDEFQINEWISKDFAAVVRAAIRRDGEVVFIDEAGFMLEPTIRKTYSPRGQTPIHRFSGPHPKISVISSLTVRPQTRRIRLDWEMLSDNLNFRWPAIFEFVWRLRTRLARPITIIWDQIPIHTCESLVARLTEMPSVVYKTFPPYAPEINPADGIWRYIKTNRIPNYAPSDLGVLRSTLTDELNRLRKRPDLLRGFIRYTELPIRVD
jgi:transposase